MVYIENIPFKPLTENCLVSELKYNESRLTGVVDSDKTDIDCCSTLVAGLWSVV